MSIDSSADLLFRISADSAEAEAALGVTEAGAEGVPQVLVASRTCMPP